MKILEFQVDITSRKCSLFLMSVTVLKYDQERYSHGWDRCVFDVTHAMSGLMLFFIDF